jgi:hypothetical protein
LSRGVEIWELFVQNGSSSLKINKKPNYFPYRSHCSSVNLFLLPLVLRNPTFPLGLVYRKALSTS